VNKVKISFVLLVLIFVLSGCRGHSAVETPSQPANQTPVITQKGSGWAKDYSGVAYFNSIQEMSDGGYILAGDTGSWDGSTTSDILVLKVNSNGDKEWAKAFGRNGSYNGVPVVQSTNDGGYFVAGVTGSYVKGSGRFIIVKFNSKNDEEWARVFGLGEKTVVSGPTDFTIQQTDDGGFVVASRVGGNCFILKLDPKGNKEWLKVFNKLRLRSIKQTKDGGYIIGGAVGDHPLGLLIKLERSGCIEWTKTYKDKLSELGSEFWYVEPTRDRGYMFFSSDSLILKLDENGNEEWRKVFGRFGGHHDIASIRQTNDGGYIAVGGKSVSNEVNSFIIKLDSKGNTEWAKLTAKDYNFRVIQQTTDGGYIAAGMGTVFKFDSRGNMGNSNCLKDYDPGTVVPPFKVEVTDITKEVKVEPEPSFRSELINLSFIAKDVQVTTICDGK
jgi:hypothetical protein